MKLDQYRIDFC